MHGVKVSASATQHITTVTHPHNLLKVTRITGKLNNKATQMLFDSGVTCSVASKMHVDVSPGQHIILVNADLSHHLAHQ